jgi:phosphatidylglycerol:prolipoprotein diacylglycerol transferase
VSEVAFRIGNLAVHWYGIFVAMGFMLGVWTAGQRGRRDGLEPETITDLALWIFGGAFLGARLLYVITFWNEEFSGQSLLKIFALRSGFVFYGGLIGAAVTAIAYTRWKKLPTWKLADALGPSVSLGHALGRIGCLMTGCCYGSVCSLPWAIKYPFGHPSHPNLVHPVQVYEAALNLALYGALAWLYRRKRFDGQVFAWYLLGYGVIRATVELFRGDYPDSQMTGWMTPAHRVSAVILLLGAGLYFWFRSRVRENDSQSVSN